MSAAELCDRRKAHTLTQAVASRLFGVTSTTIARWERSEQRIGNPERVAAALSRLERAASIEETDGSSSPPQSLYNLPTELTSFIGRGQDVADIQRLLATGRL